jgi:hypothetical protein
MTTLVEVQQNIQTSLSFDEIVQNLSLLEGNNAKTLIYS